jgi:hypothetical protein
MSRLWFQLKMPNEIDTQKYQNNYSTPHPLTENGLKVPCVVLPLRVMVKVLLEESRKVLFCAPLVPSPWSSRVVWLKLGSVSAPPPPAPAAPIISVVMSDIVFPYAGVLESALATIP